MLDALLGNRNVARILFFLLVNEKGYASQIQSLLDIPLTPVQQALLKLEKREIIDKQREGKMQMYTFNPFYPLRNELEMLIRKAYTLLSPQEKRGYAFAPSKKVRFTGQGSLERQRQNALLALWQHLKEMRTLACAAKTREGQHQSVKTGKAEVLVSEPTLHVLVFQEKGDWLQGDIPQTSFSNCFRWTLDLSGCVVTLEHLRYGEAHPVHLLHLTPTQPRTLESVHAHLCAEDTYLGHLVWNKQGIDFYWRIIGPLKNTHLSYHYAKAKV